MDSESGGVTALVSVHPEFAELILAGRKRVEFRKTRFSEAVTCVAMYVTRPVQRILGFFEVSAVHEDTPRRLWHRYSAQGGITRAVFSEYYRQRRRGVAIEVGRVFVLSRPMTLSEVTRNSTPPQSFTYLSGRAVKKLVSGAGERRDDE